jgi:L-aspartate oxidase
MAYRTPQESAKCDVLVLGSGIAGLLLCHSLAQTKLKIVLACKGTLIDSNTSHAQGGLAAVTPANPIDSIESHLADTLASGAGLTDPVTAMNILSKGTQLTERLGELGVAFDKKGDRLDTALEGGHAFARVLHSKDASGRAISTALIQKLQDADNVTIWENTFAADVLMSDGRCIGVQFLSDNGKVPVFARHVVLATGGLGRVFARTSNPDVATGDGIAMAYRAGARLVDMEFVQFHPTAFCQPGAPASLISEAIRGAGAHLLDDSGDRFAFRFDSRGELATRDIVARAIYTTMVEREQPNVWLDMRPIGAARIEEKFPNIIAKCREFGVDPVTEPVPIAPAAHYFMGGIWSDAWGRTSVPGLYAIGECASTGLHGANRLASNSLLEGGVMALLLSELIQGSSKQALRRPHYALGPTIAVPPYSMLRDVDAFRADMFKNVGLERSQQGLQQILNRIPETIAEQSPGTRAEAEAANIGLLGWLIARCAYERRESRGAHWRTDYPALDDRHFLRRFSISRTDSGWIDVPAVRTVIVVETPARAVLP